MKNNVLTASFVLIYLLLIVGVVYFIKPVQDVSGAAFTGQAAYQQIATTTQAGPGARNTIFADAGSNSCKARVITATSSIYVLFGDPTNGDFASTTLPLTTGHFVATGTTMFDAGLYGCGRWTAYSPASTTLLISQF